MSKTRKIILSIGVAITMLVALVIGFSIPKADTKGDGAPNIPNINNIDKPKTITYQAGEIEVVGTNQNTINYTYSPSNNAKSTSVKAYEYIFGRPSQVSDTMAVTLQPLEEIDGATISYFYADEPQTFDDTTTVDTAFKAQIIDTANTNIYLYVIVSPSDANIPVDFTTNIVWNFGVAGTMTYMVNGTPTTETIVKGQPLPEPETPTTTEEGYYFDAWFYDADFTQLASFPVETQGQNLYARFHNFPLNSSCMTYSNGSYGVTSNPEIGNLVIPTLYNDGVNGVAPVTSIASGAFYNTGGSYVLPSSLISIYNGAFEMNTSSSVDFASCINLTTIDSYAFVSSGITSIDLSNCVSLKNIFDNAFYVSKSLVTVTLPKSLTTIGDNAFNGCTALNSVNFKDLSNLNSIGIGAFTETAITDIDLSNTKITEIGQSFPTTLKAIKFPSSLESILNEAFLDYTSLSEVDFAKCTSLSSLGESSFRGTGLTSVELFNCVKLTSTGKNSFRSCAKLETIILPINLQSIDYGTFGICEKLTSVGNLSNYKDLTIIDEFAFYQCTSLTYVGDLSKCDNLSRIGGNAFRECSNLTNIKLPKSLMNLDTSVFYDCTNLVSVDLSLCTSLTSMGKNAFRGCSNLKNVILSENLLTIDDYAFCQCFSLTSLTLPKTITTIGKYAFRETALTEMELSACTKLTAINDSAFEKCTELVKVSFPTSITSLGTYVFNKASKLASVDLSGCTGLTVIPDVAFSQTGLTSVKLPSNITYIGFSAFNRCKFTTIDLSGFTGLTAISDWSFSQTGLTSIKLPSAITYIGFAAFNQCNFTTIDLSVCTNLQTIGGGAFCDCTELTSVILPATLSSMGYHDVNTEQTSGVFAGCTALTSVTFNDTSTWYVTTDATVWDNCDTSAATEVIGLTTTASNENATLLKTTYVGYYWFKVD